MASTGQNLLITGGRRTKNEKRHENDQVQSEKLPSSLIKDGNDHEAAIPRAFEEMSLSKSHSDQTHRRLKSRHIQLIGIGGCVDV